MRAILMNSCRCWNCHNLFLPEEEGLLLCGAAPPSILSPSKPSVNPNKQLPPHFIPACPASSPRLISRCRPPLQQGKNGATLSLLLQCAWTLLLFIAVLLRSKSEVCSGNLQQRRHRTDMRCVAPFATKTSAVLFHFLIFLAVVG